MAKCRVIYSCMNLNDCVWVKLTDHGLRVMWRRDDYYSEAEKRGKWQLWRLMQVFGKAQEMGGETAFERNEVHVTKPDWWTE